MIYFDDHIWDFDLHQALAAMTRWRREYALRYRRELDQRLSVAAYRLLLQALQTEYGITQQPRFIYNDRGKPSLEGYPEIHFSLSHCSQAVACAVSHLPVGIDVETTDHYNDELAREVMSYSEMRLINSSFNPAAAFTRLWTMKESLYKLRGVSLAIGIPNMLDHVQGYRFNTVVHSNCIITSCSMT